MKNLHKTITPEHMHNIIYGIDPVPAGYALRESKVKPTLPTDQMLATWTPTMDPDDKTYYWLEPLSLRATN